MSLADLDTQLRIAWQDLLDARKAWARSPNSESIQLAMIAEARVNRLLERRHVLVQAEAIVSA